MYERERYEAERDQLPQPIDTRYYGEYADVTGRMGVGWVERTVEEWEDD